MTPETLRAAAKRCCRYCAAGHELHPRTDAIGGPGTVYELLPYAEGLMHEVLKDCDTPTPGLSLPWQTGVPCPAAPLHALAAEMEAPYKEGVRPAWVKKPLPGIVG